MIYVSIVEHPTSAGAARRAIRGAGWWVAGLFWLVQLLELLVVGLVEGRAKAGALLASRTLIVGTGIILTIPIIEVAVRTTGRPFRARLVITVCTALAMCVALVWVTYLKVVAFSPGPTHFDPVEFVYSAFGWSWFLLGVSGAVVGVSYSLEVRDRERRLAALEIVARDARLATLRYQLNPHFLFNTLNSIAALIQGREVEAAEEMTESLSDFLRTTLDLDPVEDISVAREIQLQALYLSIEEVRFPDRLRSSFDVDPAAAGAQIPALLMQPLVENAIIHGVARSADPVTVVIQAKRSGARLILIVENDSGSLTARVQPRSGVGLVNVEARMRARFGADQRLSSGTEGGRFRVQLDLPFVGQP